MTNDNSEQKIYFSSDDGNFILYSDDCRNVLCDMPEESVDLIFADPPYGLSDGGITCKSGKMVSVNKGKWDVPKIIADMHNFNTEWLTLCKRVLKPNGTIFVSGTNHVIFSIGFAMQQLGFKILNDIAWYKVNPPPNLSCRYFTHATETIIWASRDAKSKHFFDYQAMKSKNGGKQMQSLWSIKPPLKSEKFFGKHPTQKPFALLDRIVRAASQQGDIVVDPFSGSGTTGIVCATNNRKYIGIELETEYLDVSISRYRELSKYLKQ